MPFTLTFKGELLASEVTVRVPSKLGSSLDGTVNFTVNVQVSFGAFGARLVPHVLDDMLKLPVLPESAFTWIALMLTKVWPVFVKVKACVPVVPEESDGIST